MIEVNKQLKYCLAKLARYENVEHPDRRAHREVTVKILEPCVLGIAHKVHQDELGRTWK